MLTQKRLKELLHYDPYTGVFTWVAKSSIQSRIKIGDVAGGVDKSNGYVKVRVDGKKYKAHRLAFLYMTGNWPSDQVDHIDHVRSNNAWANLREATFEVNGRNASLRSNNSSGHNGIYYHKSRKRWVVQLWVGEGHERKQKTIGYFKDFESAVIVCRKTLKENGYHENHGLKLVGAA